MGLSPKVYIAPGKYSTYIFTHSFLSGSAHASQGARFLFLSCSSYRILPSEERDEKPKMVSCDATVSDSEENTYVIACSIRFADYI